jgi:LysM repeat protein
MDGAAFYKAAGKLFLAAVLFFSPLLLLAAAPPVRQGYVQDPTTTALKESVADLRHQLDNHETEIRMYDEKISNLETIIDGVRDQLNDASKAHKEQLKGNSATLEGKIVGLETTSKAIVNDMRQFKTHADEASAALTQAQQKITDLEKVIERQNQDIEHLQSAMKSLMQVLQGGDSSSTSAKGQDTPSSPPPSYSGITYRVKAGDSLEKIARSHQTTIQAIKDLNGLATDKIVVGKLLLIPDQ